MPRNALCPAAPAAAAAGGLALLVAYLLRGLLAPGLDRLPGTDAGNLYAWELFTRSVLAQGELPHWNPYQFGGTPHLADTQTTVFYPLALLLRWIPALSFLPWMAALHIWLAGTGTLFLGRVIGLGWLAASAAAVAATLGGSMTAWLSNGHFLLLYCAAWVSWALAFAVLSARRASVWPHPALVTVMVLQFLAGYLQGSVYLTCAVCSYFLYSAAWPDPKAHDMSRWRPLGQLALLGVLALGLSAFQLLPTTRLVSEAARTGGLSFELASRGGWTPSDLATFFFPFRGIESESPHRWLADRTSYVGWLLTGLMPLALFDATRRREVFFLGALAVVVVAFAFGGNLPFYQLHYAMFPGFRIPARVLLVATPALALLGAIGLERLVRTARTLDRGRFTAVAGAALIAANVLLISVLSSVLLDTPLPSARAWWLPFVTFGGVAVAVLLTARIGPAAGGLVALSVVAADLLAFSAGAVQTVPVNDAATVRRWIGAPDAGRALSLCENMVGPHELLLNRQPTFDGVGGVYLRDYADWNQLTEAEGSLPVRRDLLDAANITSIISCRPFESSAISLVSAVGSVRVYRNQTAWPRVIWTCGAQALPRDVVIDRLRVGRYENRQLVPWHVVNVRWAPGLSDDMRASLESRYHLEDAEHREESTWRYRVRSGSTEQMAALIQDPSVDDTHGVDRQTGGLVEPSVDVSEAAEELLIGARRCDERADVEIVAADRPDGRVVANVVAPAEGVLFFSEPYYPERRAFVDGVEVTPIKANVAFTAVRVSPGRHHVELRYVASAFYTGSAISAATLAAWPGAFLLGRLRRRRLPA